MQHPRCRRGSCRPSCPPCQRPPSWCWSTHPPTEVWRSERSLRVCANAPADLTGMRSCPTKANTQKSSAPQSYVVFLGFGRGHVRGAQKPCTGQVPQGHAAISKQKGGTWQALLMTYCGNVRTFLNSKPRVWKAHALLLLANHVGPSFVNGVSMLRWFS